MLDLKVIPRARNAQIVDFLADGTLKVKVIAAPEKGRANEEVCELLAGCFAVPKSRVEILVGHSSSRKRVRILA